MAGGENVGGGGCAVRCLLGTDARGQRADRLRLPTPPEGWYA